MPSPSAARRPPPSRWQRQPPRRPPPPSVAAGTAAAAAVRAAAATVGAVLLGALLTLLAAPHPAAASAVDVAFSVGGPPIGAYRADTDGLALRDDYPVSTHRGGGLPASPDGAACGVQRFSRSDHLVAHLPLGDGDYTVSLLFAEVYAAACHRRGRVFDISILSGVGPAAGTAAAAGGGARRWGWPTGTRTPPRVAAGCPSSRPFRGWT